MPIPLKNTDYSELIQKDIDWLLENTEHSLERQHIIEILRQTEREFLNAR